MLTRRQLIGTAAATLGAASALPSRPLTNSFVRRTGTNFVREGAAYRIAGTNTWYAAYLGADAPVGNRDRLKRELDRLVGLGINNVRILGSSEHSPLKNSVRPAFRNRNRFNETLMRGLDHALAEMGRRGLTAVIYLTNFWEWSGGMMTYLYWTNGGRYLDMNDPAHPWPQFPDMSSEFYGSAAAVRMFDDHVRAIVGRRNSVTGRYYRDDPAIMAWQLANEPRPGGSQEAGRRHMKAYLAWIDRSARLIKSLDRNHMVATGSEGTIIMEHDRIVAADLRTPDPSLISPSAGDQNASASSPIVSDVSGHRRLIEDFLRAIENNGRPVCDGRDGKRSVGLIEAIYESSRRGLPVNIRN